MVEAWNPRSCSSRIEMFELSPVPLSVEMLPVHSQHLYVAMEQVVVGLHTNVNLQHRTQRTEALLSGNWSFWRNT